MVSGWFFAYHVGFWLVCAAFNGCLLNGFTLYSNVFGNAKSRYAPVGTTRDTSTKIAAAAGLLVLQHDKITMAREHIKTKLTTTFCKVDWMKAKLEFLNDHLESDSLKMG